MTKILKGWWPALVMALVVPLGLAMAASSGMFQYGTPQLNPQTPPTSQSGRPPARPGLPDAGTDKDPELDRMLARQAMKRNEARQDQLVKDTDKLLALATELKSEVSKTNKDVMSIEVIKKADEIQKLAKSVRDKMKADNQ